jgi:raffinose/stachyose/melibiose transport system substrate-binding protein
MKGFVDAGALLPLNEYLTDGSESRLVNGTLDNMTFDGKVYGLPYIMSVGSFFVNEKLFADAGLKVPANWDELIAVCNAFLAKGITPLSIGGKEGWCITMYLDMMELRQAGEAGLKAAYNKTASFNSPDFIEAARKMQQLVDMGAFGKGAMGISRDEAEVPFYDGKVPMYFNGSWTVGNVIRPDCKARDDIMIYPFPALGPKSNLNDFTGGVGDIFVVSNKSKHKEEAVQALKFITEHMAEEVYLSGSGIPAWKLDVDINTDNEAITPLFRSLVRLTSMASSFTLWGDTSLEGADAQKYLNAATSLFGKQITPEEFGAVMGTIQK